MKKVLSAVLIIVLCLVMILPNYIYANNEITTENYKGIYKSGENNSKLTAAGGKVLGVARVIGVSCGVILLIILGIKYMLMSHDADDKAKIKEKLIPYVIGAVILFAGSAILTIIANVVQKINV